MAQEAESGPEATRYEHHHWKRPGTKLSPEERARMTQLVEEVYSRTTEMALIVSKKLKLQSAAPVRSFRLTTRDSASGMSVRLAGIEVIISPETGDCMIYDYDEGVCIPCADA